MPKVILLADIISILESGDFDQLIGGMENDYLECKGEPYKLEQEIGKMELAKDISALANADGGVILIGVTTEKDLALADVIRRCGCFAEGFIDFNKYENIISDWVVPSIPGLRLKWHPSSVNPKEGVVSILVPQTACQERPYIVGRIIDDTGKVSGSYVGFFERKRDRVPPIRPSELRERLKDGLRFAELNTRLMNVEEMVGKTAARDLNQPPSYPTKDFTLVPVLPVETILGRIQRTREEVGFGSRATFSLVAWSEKPINFPGLFESRDDPVVQYLEHPPQLRTDGFGLLRGRPSTIVEGKLRRCLAPGFRLLEIWRDGPLISMVEGDGGHLCWGVDSTEDVGLKINNLALTETVYLFCDWALNVYKFATPNPTQLNLRMIFSDMAPTGKPFSLNPHPAGTWGFRFYDNSKRAPEPTGKHFETQVDFADAEPGAIAYKLLVDLYTWFGFEANQVPYANRERQPTQIDPAIIISAATLR
jgi:hypothetical protein